MLDNVFVSDNIAPSTLNRSEDRKQGRGGSGLGRDQLPGTLSSWWTKIVIGLLLLAFILLQRLAFVRKR